MPEVLNHDTLNKGILRTKNCKGCNKCLTNCPVFGASVAFNEDGMNKIAVDSERCILCGRCLSECTHGAREYLDDTECFIQDLGIGSGGKRVKQISILVAPSFIINYPNRYKNILGYLKHMGVNHIYNVSFGADITTWGYINYMRGKNKTGVIARPCPPIVKYVEKFHPALLPRLLPIQSPAMCTAIYLKKYLGVEDDLAFLGPCVAKKSEFERPENEGLVKYNVTFQRLMEYFDKVDISSYSRADSELECVMDSMYPADGGLRENLEYYLDLDTERYVSLKGEVDQCYTYLDYYADRLDFDDPYRGVIIDILNCARGCNYGPATEFKNSPSNHIPYAVNRVRAEKNGRKQIDDTAKDRLNDLNKRFTDLNIDDFFAGCSDEAIELPSLSKQEMDATFIKMLKFTDGERKMDCSACGMRSCGAMAAAIALGYNYKDNCVHYVKKKLFQEQSESVLQKQKYELLRASKLTNIIWNTDNLTGLADRYGFENQMLKSMRVARQTAMSGYVLLMDFDDFKTVNESYGMECGNSMLIEFARFLKKNFGETAYIFRIDGDEFALVLEDCTRAEAHNVVGTIMERTQKIWEVLGERFYCTISLGAAPFPDADASAEDTVRHGEMSMYTAKRQGKNASVFYSEDVQRANKISTEMIRSMRDAVSAGFVGFSMEYQPWVGMDGRIVGCESLIRWNHDGKQVSPDEFIPVAEQTGLINSLGDFALREASEVCREINRSYDPKFSISVNASAKQFKTADIFDRFMNIMTQSGVLLSNLILEVTESVGLDSGGIGRQTIERFADRGVSVALDDFGTGYSSLSYLNEFSFDLIKIDRSFIKDFGDDQYYGRLLSMISELMHNMGRRVCVEGVETDEQLEFCRKRDIDLVQGYYYYKPMPFEQLKEVLKTHKSK